ncbi:fimbrial protein [Pseudomonas sp. RT6P73]
MKRAALIIAMTALPLVTFAASQNTLTFKGEVASQTCQVSIDGSSATVVLLPTVSAQSLNKKDTTAGETTFSVMLSDCAAPKQDTPILTRFQGSNVTEGGNLGNTGTASGVAVQLLDPNGEPVRLSGLTSVEGLVLKQDSTSADSTFSVRYISEGGKATAGSVTATVQYSISYL